MARFNPVWPLSILLSIVLSTGHSQTFNGQGGMLVPPGAPAQTVGITISPCVVAGVGVLGTGCTTLDHLTLNFTHTFVGDVALFLLSSTVGSEAWNSRDLKSRPH